MLNPYLVHNVYLQELVWAATDGEDLRYSKECNAGRPWPTGVYAQEWREFLEEYVL